MPHITLSFHAILSLPEGIELSADELADSLQHFVDHDPLKRQRGQLLSVTHALHVAVRDAIHADMRITDPDVIKDSAIIRGALNAVGLTITQGQMGDQSVIPNPPDLRFVDFRINVSPLKKDS